MSYCCQSLIPSTENNFFFTLETSTSPTGPITSGPLPVSKNTRVRFWDPSGIINVTQGSVNVGPFFSATASSIFVTDSTLRIVRYNSNPSIVLQDANFVISNNNNYSGVLTSSDNNNFIAGGSFNSITKLTGTISNNSLIGGSNNSIVDSVSSSIQSSRDSNIVNNSIRSGILSSSSVIFRNTQESSSISSATSEIRNANGSSIIDSIDCKIENTSNTYINFCSILNSFKCDISSIPLGVTAAMERNVIIASNNSTIRQLRNNSNINNNIIIKAETSSILDTFAITGTTDINKNFILGDRCIISDNYSSLNDGNVFFADSNLSSTIMVNDTSLGLFTYDSFRARFRGGYVLYSNSLLTSGVVLTPGSSSWASVSDRDMKENINKLNYDEVHQKLKEIDIYEFNYKGSNKKCYGTMADEWNKNFNKDSDKTINILDMVSVCIASIKKLSEKIERIEKMVQI